MTKYLTAYFSMAAFATATALIASAMAAQAPVAPQSLQTPELEAQRSTVYITKSDIAKAVAARDKRLTLSGLGAIRAGDDRVSVDILKRADADAEGPVTHDVVTEVYYILDGGGVMETGGVIPNAVPLAADGKPVNPASIGPTYSGPTIEGGVTRHVSAGDVVMIPPRTPHHFKSLDGSVTYLVVRSNPGYEKGR